ncbi:rod shape-determining protein MreC [Carnobacteriaceae bacterium zg-C25]|nr:rod shape-determining protein MreC [Carnobacteriaceae bacterium zg-C25]
MKFFNSKKVLYVTVVSVILLTLTTISVINGNSNPLSSLSNNSIGWVTRVLSEPAKIVDNVTKSFNGLLHAYEENQVLKPQMNTLFALQAQNEQLRLENEQLRQQLNIKATLSDYETIPATVISRSPDSWIDQLTINVGKNDGVQENMIIVSNGSVAGKVVSVTDNSAKVIILSNTSIDAISLSAMIQNNTSTIYGVVSKYDATTKTLKMSNLDLSADVQIGQQVTTSGLSGNAPKGLLIGTVESVTVDASGLFKEATIRPSQDYLTIQHVFVIKRMIAGE